MARNTTARALHDVGLAAWFGGSLMGAVGLNAASGAVTDPREAGRVANAGWDRWTPVNLAAIGAHLAGGAVLLAANRGRVASQEGVAEMTGVKTLLTAAALGLTAYSRVAGRKLSQAGDVPAESGTEPAAQTPEHLAKAQRQLKVLQWLVPASTAGILVANALAGEQQRASEVSKGLAGRLGLGS